MVEKEVWAREAVTQHRLSCVQPDRGRPRGEPHKAREHPGAAMSKGRRAGLLGGGGPHRMGGDSVQHGQVSWVRALRRGLGTPRPQLISEQQPPGAVIMGRVKAGWP